MRYKIVLVEPTEDMLTAALYAMDQPRMRVNDAKRDKINGLFVGMGAMLAAAPKASEDEELEHLLTDTTGDKHDERMGGRNLRKVPAFSFSKSTCKESVQVQSSRIA